MSIGCSELIAKIEEKYPRNLAEDYDNVGLILGSCDREISKVLIALDITSEVVQEAIDTGADMIIAHHPLIFKGIKKILKGNPLSDMIIKLIKADINVYALHTNFDNAWGGMNDILAQLLELQEVTTLAKNQSSQLVKLAVFVPATHHDIVMKAVLDAGAGHIGNYSHCSFNTVGTGTFKPLEGSNPYIGTSGSLERVEEVKIETIIEVSKMDKVITEMLKAHPYEEVAYDIYPLVNKIENGTGRIGFLKEEMRLEEFCQFIKRRFNIPCLSVGGSLTRIIKRIAVVGGAGADFVSEALNRGVDVLITGDIKHHEAMDAVAAGLSVIDAGHYFTEAAALPYISRFISSISDIECQVTQYNTNSLIRI